MPEEAPRNKSNEEGHSKLFSISMDRRNSRYSTKSEGGVNLHDLYATNTKNKQYDILPFFIASKVKTVWRLRRGCGCPRGTGGFGSATASDSAHQSVVRALYSHRSRAICAHAAFASPLLIINISVQCSATLPVTLSTTGLQ